MAENSIIALSQILNRVHDDDDDSVEIVYRRLLNSSSNDGEIVTAGVRAAIGDSMGGASGGCVENFFEEVVPFYTVSSFRSHFRMNYSTFEVKVQVSYSCIVISSLGAALIIMIIILSSFDINIVIIIIHCNLSFFTDNLINI